MAFIESPSFPLIPGIGIEGGPTYVTDIVAMTSGWEQRRVVQSLPRQQYTMSFVGRPTMEFNTLTSFFRVVKGRAHGFRFKDPLDFEASSSEGILTVIAGSPSNYYQMYKRYTSGAYTDDRKIRKPVSGTVIVYQNGLPMGSGYSIDYTTGIVFISAGSGTFTWQGEFDVPVRLNTDLLKPSAQPIGGGERLWTLDSFELIELRT